MLKNITFFNIRTIPSTPGLHRICASQRLWVITTDRELGTRFPHPAPKEIVLIVYQSRNVSSKKCVRSIYNGRKSNERDFHL